MNAVVLYLAVFLWFVPGQLNGSFPSQLPPGLDALPPGFFVAGPFVVWASRAGWILSGGTSASRRRRTATLVAVLLGWLGVQRFYLGRFGSGLLAIFFSMTLIPAVLGVIEGLRYAFMSDLEFGAMEERRKQREKEREAEETWAEESSWLPDHMSDQEWRDLEKAADLEESLYRLELDARFEKIERRHEQDVELARRVEIELLRERESLRGEIDVMAHDGVVLLQGRLGSPEEVIQLEAQARKVRGVTEVENLMKP